MVISWRRKWQPTPVFLPGESHGQRSLVGCCPWGCTESNTIEATSVHGIGGGNGNPLKYSCLENPRDRGAWWVAIYGDATEVTQQQQQHNLCTLHADRLPPHWAEWVAQDGAVRQCLHKKKGRKCSPSCENAQLWIWDVLFLLNSSLSTPLFLHSLQLTVTELLPLMLPYSDSKKNSKEGKKENSLEFQEEDHKEGT